jgi:arylsulfatase A-like enzyme
MFTGRFPHEMSADWRVPLDGTFPTLAEILSAKGYATAGFIANTGYCSFESGLQRGFTHYEDYRLSLGQIVANSTLLRTIADNFRLRRLIENDEHVHRQGADLITDDFLKWLSNVKNRQFFAFLNYFDAHEPYLPPQPFDTKFGKGRQNGKLSPLHRWNWDPAEGHNNMGEQEIQEERNAYDGALAYLDQQLGFLFDELKKRGVLDQTIIIITSDHGEEFGEHGLFDHGNSLYLPSVHVPLLISFPNKIPTGTRIQEPASLRDLPATVMDILGFGGESPFPGSSLSRYWDKKERSKNSLPTPILSEVNFVSSRPDWFPASKGDMKSLIYKELRYIKNGDGSEELYDLKKDPWEKQNLNQEKERQTELEEFRERLDTALSSPSIP